MNRLVEIGRRTIIETSRLRLCEYDETDALALHGILSDPQVMAHWPAPFSESETERWVDRARLYYRLFGLGRWGAFLKDSGRLIGDCGLLVFRTSGQIYHDLGYIIDRRMWGQGFATEAARACLDYAFAIAGLERVSANMPAEHAASVRVAEKIGMRRVGLFNNPRNRNILTCLYTATPAARTA